jgi:hypothetical protein
MRGKSVFAKIQKQMPKVMPGGPVAARDLFLYALFARIALKDNDNIEFETKFNEDTNTIELIIPPKMLPLLDQITGMQRGPNFKKYIDWLIGSQSLVPPCVPKDVNFIAASGIQVFFGSEPALVDGRLILTLPSVETSVIGYNTKISDCFAGSLKVYVTWLYMCGSQTSYNLRTQVTVSDSQGGGAFTNSVDTLISTFNLLPGDIRETEVLTLGNVITPNNIINLLFSRNYDGSPDPQTEGIGIVGLRVQLDE